MRLRAYTVLFAVFAVFPALAGEELANGISVGEPKVFDNRTLTIMLESLSQTLQGLQTQAIDQKTLAAALANIQGTRSSDSSSAFSIGALPVPSRRVETIEQSNMVSSSGTALPDGLKTTTTTERAALTPSAPTLDAVPAFSGFTPAFGASAGDLLSDQVNLSYQIFNLRMILERSLSDRLTDNQPRTQAVLGFNVTIDPPKTAVDAVAEVEITLRADDKLSLVAMMPQEKTYNAATLSTKSNAFGGTAVVNMIPIGAATRSRSQIFYLYRDNDTIAYERTNGDKKNEIVFGWIFRPVLGRRSVSPGFRQLLAVVALPMADVCSVTLLADDRCPESKLTADVKTQWKKYDAATLTSFAEADANRLTRFRYNATLGLTKPEFFDQRHQNHRTYSDITVKTTAAYEKNLRPRLDRVSWTSVGAKNILISITGANFFTGTQVVLGDKSYGAADGLLLKSNDAMELVTSLEALTSGRAFISGRYGPAIPLIAKDPEEPGISISKVDITDSHGGSRMLEILLKNPGCGPPLTTALLPVNAAGGDLPIITINGNTVPFPYLIADDGLDQGVVIRGPIPDSFLSGGISVIKVTWPFLGSKWTSTMRRVDPKSNYEIVRIGDKSLLLRAKDELGFLKQVVDSRIVDLDPGQCWRLFIGDTPIRLKTHTCPDGDHSSTAISGFAIAITPSEKLPDKLALVDPSGAVFFLDVPKVSQPEAPAKPATVTQFDSVFVDLNVDDAAQVASVEADRTPLKFTPKSKTKGETTISVQLTRDLTAKPGNIDITVLDKDGKATRKRLVIEPCAMCKANQG